MSESEGGDAACWLNRVCPRCGALTEVAPGQLCPRCGASEFDEPMDGPTAVPVGDLIFDVWTLGPAHGVPVLLLHGFPETAQSWSRIAPLLAAQGCRVIVPDQRGYSSGARPEGIGAYATEHLVSDVIGLLDALDLAAVHIVGHDWGAAVAWPLVVEHPDRVLTLTAVSVPHLAAYGWALRHDADQQQRASYIGLFRDKSKAEELLLADDAQRLRAMFGSTVPPNLIDDHVRLLTEPGALTAALNWYRAMRPDLGDLAAVRVPTTYVWGTADIALGRAGAVRCGEHVDAPYRFVELEGASHWIPEEAPGILADAIAERVFGAATL